MKVIIFSHYFPPEGNAPASRMYALARRWVASGDPNVRGQFLRKHWLLLMWAAFQSTFLHRRVRERLIQHIGAKICCVNRLLGRRMRDRAAEPSLPSGTWSNLLSIAVHPSSRGQGVGSALLDGFCAESIYRGFSTVRLSVHNDNSSAIALYRRRGWRPVLVTERGTFFTRSLTGEA